MSDSPVSPRLAVDDQTIVYLRALGAQYPNIDATLAAIAHLRATLTLPKGTIHVVSDVHGEFKKLIHVINNASGSLRPLVEQTFGHRLTAGEKLDLLNMIYYPRETYPMLAQRWPDDDGRRHFLRRQTRLELELLRRISRPYSLENIERVFPASHKDLFRELLFSGYLERNDDYLNAILDEYVAHGQELPFLRLLARVIRNLLFSELIVAGDFGDRGPRIDKVIDYVMRQPNVALVWGNHDVSWMGACLGQEACIANALRMSLRYQRLFQLEMGYGIPMAALEKLVRTVYHDDPAERFPCLGQGIRDPLMMSRMQKAMAIIQFKLEAQTIAAQPAMGSGTPAAARPGQRRTRHDPARRRRASAGRRTFPDRGLERPHPALARGRGMHGATQNLVPAKPDALGTDALPRTQGHHAPRARLQPHLPRLRAGERSGRVLAHASGRRTVSRQGALRGAQPAVHRAFREQRPPDLDLLWYLWCGPLSPLFGKDKIATFESYFIADKATHKEEKDPYFKLIHEKEFCRSILRDFGVDESTASSSTATCRSRSSRANRPSKKAGRRSPSTARSRRSTATTGSRSCSTPTAPTSRSTTISRSISEAITQGADIIPTIQDVSVFDPPRRVGIPTG